MQSILAQIERMEKTNLQLTKKVKKNENENQINQREIGKMQESITTKND